MRTLRRVLVVQPYGIGDLLFVTPVLRALRLIPTVERVDLLLGSRNGAVVRSNPHVDQIFEIDKDLFHRQGRWKTFQDAARLGRTLRARRYDLLLDYSLRGEYAFFGQWVLGIPKRAGYDYKRRAFFHTHRLSLPEGFKGRHVAETCCDLAELAGVPVRDRWLEFYPEASAAEQVRRILAQEIPGKPWVRFAAVSPGGGESWGKDAHFKRWAPEKFAEFTDRVCSRLGLEGAVVVGGSGEKALSERLASAMKAPALDLTGRLTLPETAAVLDLAAIFIGNDGGLLHLACARRKPAAGFYGPVDPAVYGPYPVSPFHAAIVKEGLECRPCYRKFRYKSDCPDRRCLSGLSVQEAFESLEQKSFFKQLLQNPVLQPASKQV